MTGRVRGACRVAYAIAFLASFLLIEHTTRAVGALVDLTWTGTTAAGSANDGLGLFGPAGPIAGGTPYTATYRFDTSIGFVENLTNGSQEVYGGSSTLPSPTPTPLVSASLTLNGMTVAMSGDYYAQYFRQTGQGASQMSTLAQREVMSVNPYGGESFQRVFRTGDFYALLLEAAGEFDFDASDSPFGHFAYIEYDGQGNISGTTDVNMIPTHLSITGVVPEPSSYALAASSVFAAGSGLIVRRRRRRA